MRFDDIQVGSRPRRVSECLDEDVCGIRFLSADVARVEETISVHIVEIIQYSALEILRSGRGFVKSNEFLDVAAVPFVVARGIDAAELIIIIDIDADDALNALEQYDPLKARLIEMRFFGGLTAEESAEVLGVPVERVRSQLRLAQAWLQRELDRDVGNAT